MLVGLARPMWNGHSCPLPLTLILLLNFTPCRVPPPSRILRRVGFHERRNTLWISLTAAVACTKMVYTGATMALAKRTRTKAARARHVRRSVTLPPKIAKQVETLAKERSLSDNRVLVELIEQGIEARRQKEKAFFQLAERFRAADDPDQVKQLGDQLGRFVFGE
jgi:hypothetical protein